MIKISRPVCPYPTALENKKYNHPKNKQALKEANSDKCMYCESKISHNGFAHIEHFRPKAQDKHPDLEFIWDNLGYACEKCNNEKSNKFHNDLPYIDPYQEIPSEFFIAYGPWLFPKNGNERADISISDIDLNRLGLLEKRSEKINDIQKVLTACHRNPNLALRKIAFDELKRESDSDKEYSFFIDALFNANNV